MTLLLRCLALLLLPLALASCAAPLGANRTPAPPLAQRSIDAYPAPALSIRTYVAIGASDTFGYGVPDPGTQGWVPQFATSLPADTRLVNLGVSGISLHRALAVDLPVALDAHPSLVTVWLAVNDLLAGMPLEAYRADLRTLLTGLHATHARVLVGNLPDLSLVPAAAGRLGADPAATVATWNAAIAAEARATGATLVDIHGGWQDLASHPEYIGPDGRHPSIDGYAHLAALFAASLP